MIVNGSTITSKVNGRDMEYGRLETPTLAQLRLLIKGSELKTTALSIEEIVADVQALHLEPDASGALFQVASQFNLLEMVSPSVTPEAGVAIYAGDATQGPACAIAAGAGTIFRNYFAPVDGRVGQSVDHQIDCLEKLGKSLGNENDRYWSMQNGYVIASAEGLTQINAKLADMDTTQLDEIRGALKIGLQWDTEVTFGDCGHLVSHAYCSALPVAYSSHAPEKWEQFARIILEATYEATLASAVINLANTGNNRVFLTLVGGGVFGNRIEWILASIKRALELFERYPLDVKIVSFGNPNPRVQELL